MKKFSIKEIKENLALLDNKKGGIAGVLDAASARVFFRDNAVAIIRQILEEKNEDETGESTEDDGSSIRFSLLELD